MALPPYAEMLHFRPKSSGGRGNKSGNKNCRRNREISTENESFVMKTHKERRAVVGDCSYGCKLGKSFAEMFRLRAGCPPPPSNPCSVQFENQNGTTSSFCSRCHDFLAKKSRIFSTFEVCICTLHFVPPLRILTKLLNVMQEFLLQKMEYFCKEILGKKSEERKVLSN